MNELINISGQQFYSATIDQVIERCSHKERCAIIIDENYLGEFVANSKDIVGESVNQIVIISENLNAVLAQLKGLNVLLISVGSFEEAVKISILGSELSKNVICISEKSNSELKSVIEVIVDLN